MPKVKCSAIILSLSIAFPRQFGYCASMFIRRTCTRRKDSGDAYFTYRLVEAVRVAKAVRQRTILNLGTEFDLAQAEWPALASRIDEIWHGQASLLCPGPVVEDLAQRYAAQLIARRAAETSVESEN